MRWLVVLVVLGSGWVVAGCRSRLDCELNGACSDDGKCVCRPGWRGPTCGSLDVDEHAKAVWPPDKERERVEANVTAYSWGFSHVKHQGRYHGYVNVGCYVCRKGMVTDSFVAHVSAQQVEGPYKLEQMALPVNAFNPHVIKTQSDSFALLFRSNDQNPDVRICSGESGAPLGPAATNSSEFAKRNHIAIATSSSPFGPWSVHHLSIAGWDHIHVSNPSIALLEDGSAILAYRFNTRTGEHVGIARAPDLLGPYGHVSNLTVPGEDPFIWRSAKDKTFHMLFHVEDGRAYSEWPSLHAFSLDGTKWHVSKSLDNKGAFSTKVKWGADTNTTTFSRRERPELVFDTDGNPLWLLTAVQEKEKRVASCKFSYAYSVAQRIRQKANPVQPYDGMELHTTK